MFSFTMESQFDSTKTQHTPNLKLCEKNTFLIKKDKALEICKHMKNINKKLP